MEVRKPVQKGVSYTSLGDNDPDDDDPLIFCGGRQKSSLVTIYGYFG
jgi:hypothetical protein